MLGVVGREFGVSETRQWLRDLPIASFDLADDMCKQAEKDA